MEAMADIVSFMEFHFKKIKFAADHHETGQMFAYSEWKNLMHRIETAKK